MQIRSQTVAREFKSGDRPDLYAGSPPTGSFEIYRIHRCESQSRVLIGACRCCPCFFPTPRGSEARAGEIASRRLLRKGRRKTRTAERRACTVPETQQATGKEICKGILKVGVVRLGAVQEHVHNKKRKTSGFDHTETILW